MLQSVKGITILIDGDYIVTAYSLYSIHIHPFYPHQQWQTCPPSTVPNSSSSHQVTTVVAAHQMVRANGPESNCVHAEVSSHVSDSQKFRSSHGPGLTSSSRLTSRCPLWQMSLYPRPRISDDRWCSCRGAIVATSGGVELREKCLFFVCAFQKEGLE